MEPQHLDRLDRKDELINAFRPIEQLFRIMSTEASEIDASIIYAYAEIGVELTGNFRRVLESVFPSNTEGLDHDSK